MLSLESNEMTALWPNDRLTLTLYATFSNSLPNWTTFVEEVFNTMLCLQGDKMSKWKTNFH